VRAVCNVPLHRLGRRRRTAWSISAEVFGVKPIASTPCAGRQRLPETALAAVAQDDAALVAESADLLFHLAVLLRARGLGLHDAVAELERRHRPG
jgi:phosphoribosyl-ATP pyrophosphohydrolase/phosphoribosyl-AMP cyclohydrolase